ncbi:MAG TPA: 4Fe-4S binding protein [Candidatus Eisenbergiella stercorigallinarum]|uniref:succinate dehydrogenase n=1 Tax=Candidatus Eisenbergiella stercorigallinarum TaxID=2838557 RepID=A0A9D2QY94_9FIRM|nr:4Fe-4S binding protein [Candidatus Eisenbergiella stercorigallinarum]
MKIKIRRQDTADSAPYWQTFAFADEGRITAAGILDRLNYRDDLTDENGVPCRRIRWECSCMQKMCGGCAMVINGRPGLACGTFIDTGQSSLLVLEPLTKFPVVTDLVVDRSILQEYQREAMMYLGTRATPDQKEYARQYSAAKCLRCGLCLEVCPNYVPSSREFFGASFVNSAYLLYSSSEDRKKEIRKQYARHFEAGCSKSLACRDICPAHLPTLSSIAYMNRHSR